MKDEYLVMSERFWGKTIKTHGRSLRRITVNEREIAGLWLEVKCCL